MAVHLRLPVVIVAVHGGHIVSARFIQLGEVPLQYLQVVQGKGLHAVDLCGIRQQPRLIPVLEVDHAVQLLRVVPPALAGAVILLGDELLHRAGLAVDLSALHDAALGVDLIDKRLGQGHFTVEEVASGLELARVRHDEIAGGKAGDILIHIKAVGKGGGHIQQHHRQSQGGDGDGSLAPAAAQIGPGHREQGHPAGGPAGPRFPSCSHLCVAHRLHRRHPSGHAARLPAGEEHRHQREQGGQQEDDRIHGHHAHHTVQLGDDHRSQLSTHQPAASPRGIPARDRARA